MREEVEGVTVKKVSGRLIPSYLLNASLDEG